MVFLKKHKNDISLIAAVLLLAGGLWLFRAVTRQTGAMAVVAVDGKTVMTLPLSENIELVIGEGVHTNTLVIKGGGAFISHASCPDGVCVDRGTVRYDGETIVCLPNKVVITVTGGGENGVDGVSR